MVLVASHFSAVCLAYLHGIPALREAADVVYWATWDADGLEILNEFRAAGIPAVSLFMDLFAFTQWNGPERTRMRAVGR